MFIFRKFKVLLEHFLQICFNTFKPTATLEERLTEGTKEMSREAIILEFNGQTLYGRWKGKKKQGQYSLLKFYIRDTILMIAAAHFILYTIREFIN